jgi:hypothetical protein
MIWTFALSRHKKARIWLGRESPAVSYDVAGVLTARQAATVRTLNNFDTAAVEINVPSGGKSQYALIVGSFEGDSGSELNCTIAYSADHDGDYNSPVDWAITAPYDKVSAGLPMSYALSISRAINDGALSAGYPSGELRIVGGAHSQASSSEFAFYHTARLLLRIISVPPDLMAYESVASILDDWRAP